MNLVNNGGSLSKKELNKSNKYNKTGLALKVAGLLMVLFGAAACSTTINAQLPAGISPRVDQGSEARFFEKMSEKDQAFQKNGDPAGQAKVSPDGKAKKVGVAHKPARAKRSRVKGSNTPIAGELRSDDMKMAQGELIPSRTREVKPAVAQETAGKDDESEKENQNGEENQAENEKDRETASNDSETDPEGEEDEKTTKVAGGEYNQVGTASWYGQAFNGRKTASGEVFDARKLTAAHRTLPLGSIILVRNMTNKKEILLRVNDRGPFVKGRVLDVSEYSAERLGFKERGLTTVGIKVIRQGAIKTLGPGATRAAFYQKQENHQGEGDETEKSVKKNPKTSRGDEAYFPVDDEKTEKAEKTPKKTRESGEREYKTEEHIKGFTVQVGLFENEYNAQNLEDNLKSFNEPVFILRRGDMYVVTMGNFKKKEDAQDVKDQLQAAGYEAFVNEP